MENKTSQITCQDCAHFVQHYIKMQLRFDTVNCGHCRKNHRRKVDHSCADFTQRDIEKERRSYNITQYLAEMSVHLDDIKEVLRHDTAPEPSL